MRPMTKVDDQMRANIPKVVEPTSTMVMSYPKCLGVINGSSSPGGPSSLIGISHSSVSADNSCLDWVREETEWEQCSRNPDVARLVKTRNMIERNRLTAVRNQLDRELEKELKRLTAERNEFADVLDNLQRRRIESRQKNVRRSCKQRIVNTVTIVQRENLYRKNRSGQLLSLSPSVKQDENPATSGRQTFNGSVQSEIDRTDSHRGSLSSIISLPELYRLASPQHLSVYKSLIESSKCISAYASKVNLEVPKP
ncbi:hypothetical protein FBUS_11438 [Fasciolopsis buskii]|uniref:Uncharacterized protein n=1 Tax=Fasciolopsis buskii TaxID=27845 RepID=A0A8E0RYB4_9TREM|nr:hypothetical protein FBUS_11438 [Fasciolopsis buski]